MPSSYSTFSLLSICPQKLSPVYVINSHDLYYMAWSSALFISEVRLLICRCFRRFIETVQNNHEYLYTFSQTPLFYSFRVGRLSATVAQTNLSALQIRQGFYPYLTRRSQRLAACQTFFYHTQVPITWFISSNKRLLNIDLPFFILASSKFLRQVVFFFVPSNEIKSITERKWGKGFQ